MEGDLLEDDEDQFAAQDQDQLQEASDESVSMESESSSEETKLSSVPASPPNKSTEPISRYHLSREELMQEMGALVLLGNVMLFAVFRDQETTMPLVLLTVWNMFIFLRVFTWIKYAEWTGYSKAQMAQVSTKLATTVSKQNPAPESSTLTARGKNPAPSCQKVR